MRKGRAPTKGTKVEKKVSNPCRLAPAIRRNRNCSKEASSGDYRRQRKYCNTFKPHLLEAVPRPSPPNFNVVRQRSALTNLFRHLPKTFNGGLAKSCITFWEPPLSPPSLNIEKLAGSSVGNCRGRLPNNIKSRGERGSLTSKTSIPNSSRHE